MRAIAIILLTILVAPQFSNAQTEASTAMQQLKEGALIVKLIVPQKKLDALLSSNKKEEMIALEEETKMRHEQIIQAFETTYTFSKVYFILTPDIGKLADGDPTVLFDTKGHSADQIPPSWLYIELSESPKRGIDGFVVRDSEHFVLTKPFPYFVSQWDFLHINKRTYIEMLAIWQKKLEHLASKLD